MMNVMTYKGYKARIEFDPRDNIFVGRVLGIEDGISFHGETVAALKERFAAAINYYLADCKAMGRKPEKPASANSCFASRRRYMPRRLWWPGHRAKV